MKIKLLIIFLSLCSLCYANEITVDGITAEPHIIQNQSTTVTQDPFLNFIGDSVNVYSAGGKSVVNITSNATTLNSTANLTYLWKSGLNADQDINISPYNFSLGGLRINGTQAGLVNITNNTATFFFINGTNGYVGINTSTPKNILDVSLTASGVTKPFVISNDKTAGTLSGVEMGFRPADFAATYYGARIGNIITNTTTNLADLYFAVYDNSAAAPPEKMRLTSGGNLGIGTPLPNTTLEVRGNITILSGADIRPTVDSTTAINIANATGTDFVIIDTTNKQVGIGKSPTNTLDVNGTINAATSISSGGGSANHTVCWKPDAKTLGYCSSIVGVDGTCTCN